MIAVSTHCLDVDRSNCSKKNFQRVYLVILRACNELLRRLSRAEDAVFCGRVFIYVFQSFPLGDKSSVNRHGDYNVDNVTTFDEAPSQELEDSAQKDVTMTDADTTTEPTNSLEEKDGEISDPNKPKSLETDQMYPTFWGLQKSFAYPPHVFDPKLLEEFKKGFEATLAKFNSVPKVMSAPVADNTRGSKRKSSEEEQEDFENDESLKRQASEDDIANNFNPKYLTSRELFELELSDLAFQRHILVQATILLDFLLSFTESAKKKLPTRIQQRIQFTLSEEDVSGYPPLSKRTNADRF